MDTINLTLLSNLIRARLNSANVDNTEWVDKHTVYIDKLLEALPHGSGIDRGMTLNYDLSTDIKIVFDFAWHHMDEDGFYCGESDHQLIITPMFSDKDLRITGRRQADIKDYLYQLFDSVFVVVSLSETQTERIKLHNLINPKISN